MKKMLMMFLVGIMVFASMGSAYAAETADNQAKTAKVEMLRALQDEIHQINELRMERLDVRKEIVEKHDTMLDLYIEAKENGNKESLVAAKEVRAQLKDLNDELQAVHNQIKTARQSLKEAKKNGDTDHAETLANEIISLGQEFDNKLSDKVNLLEEIINILS
ncbi:uncharacterized coiled-coil DUF342 family protein [Anaerosolibacter carboniphilus]|uniref:Uncharacterized coiled-coil DUF342 family protein n=1 Tax=Anaerosolibacter carboniphilus TaxID=1417629 RepID=A0A841KV84_9FIRM|nr:hypothetical protein [Anaerosolibacter carboniphilus]MBB6214095.1 uncharacterized coiled-coil DUF342 family protein [Anaerosolibacter carboniphilus]